MATKAPAKKAPAKKAPAKKAAPAAKAPPKGTGNTNLDNILKLVRSNGKDGSTVKDLATRAGISLDLTRKGVKQLEELGKVKRDGTMILPVDGRTGRRSEDVVERDNAILANIKQSGKEGLSLQDAADAVGCTRHLAYESVWRLRNEGKVERTGATRNARWVALK